MTSTQETFNDILGKLEQVHKMKSGWYQAICPYHDDHKQSLNLILNDDGKIGFNCHVCGKEKTPAIVQSLGFTMSDLFPGENGGKPTKPRQKRRIVKTYDYTDETGNLLFQTVRYEPKDFTQRRPGPNGFVWSLDDVRRVLYNLPTLAKLEPGNTVYVCEGEKSVGAISGLGVVATTSPLGAGKWRSEYNEILRSQNVIILTDNDQGGKDHAQTVCDSLFGIAQSVKILMLPNLTDKGDPFDWLQAGGTLAELEKLVKETKERKRAGRPQKQKLKTSDYINLFQDWNYRLRLNLCDDSIEVNDLKMDDTQEAQINAKVRDYGITTNVTTNIAHAKEAMITNASTNRYHPVKDYLNSLKWDGQDTIAVLAEYFTDNDKRFYKWLFHWLCGAIAKVYDGFQNPMLVLDGTQEIGKGFFANWLCPIPKYFNESAIYPDNKDCKLRLTNTFVWEVQELGATTRRADLEALKAFLTTQIVRDRKPYGHYDMQKPSIASFIGTINNDAGFLVDRTGNRRFLVCTLDKIDWCYADDIDVNQVWAQAKAIYDTGDAWKLDDADKKDRDISNQDFMVDSPVEAYLSEITAYTGNYTDVVTLPQVLDRLSGRVVGINQKWQTMTIASVYKSWGANKKRRTINGTQMTVYYGISFT